MPKTTVLDPQGQNRSRKRSRLARLRRKMIRNVRQGKFFVLELDGLTRDEAKTQVERIARDVLTNPVIENLPLRNPRTDPLRSQPDACARTNDTVIFLPP